MSWRASIRITLLAILHLAFANASSAFAQAGSVGGTIGNQDKTISGGEQADRPRAAPHPKRAATNSSETSSGPACSRIVGTWSWGYGVTEMVFYANGTVRQSVTNNRGSWTCAGSVVTSVFASGDRDRISMSKDGNSASVTTTWAGGHTFSVTRRSGG
jgi:hypothetical protein